MDSLGFPLSSKTKQAILDIIFDYHSDGDIDPAIFIPSDGYFSFYTRIVEGCRARVTPKTHQDIANLVNLVKHSESTRNSVEDVLRNKFLDLEAEDRDEILESWISLATRLLLMVPTRRLLTAGQSITVSGETKMNWKDGTIKDLVNKEFVHQTAMKDAVKLEKSSMPGILSVLLGLSRVHLSSNQPQLLHHPTNTIFPSTLIDETLRTLALLLPEHDSGVEKWFSGHKVRLQRCGKLPLDPLARECGQLKVEERQIDNFEYWHDRLIILKQVFDEAEPGNLKQWWCDRRKRVQWYTFWVAALVLGLTVIFGIVQCVEGALQVYLAAGRTL